MDLDGALDRAKGVLGSADDVRGSGQLFEHSRLVEQRLLIQELRGPPVVEVGLAVRLQRSRPPRGEQCVLGKDLICARGLRVVDDVCGLGVRGEHGVEDLGVQTPPHGDRQPRSDRVSRQLMAKAHGGGVDLEQLPTLGLECSFGPVRHHLVEQGCAYATGHHRDQLHQAARVVIEPGGASEHRVRDRRRWLGRAA